MKKKAKKKREYYAPYLRIHGKPVRSGRIVYSVNRYTGYLDQVKVSCENNTSALVYFLDETIAKQYQSLKLTQISIEKALKSLEF